jgi:hypothetical protein
MPWRISQPRWKTAGTALSPRFNFIDVFQQRSAEAFKGAVVAMWHWHAMRRTLVGLVLSH